METPKDITDHQSHAPKTGADCRFTEYHGYSLTTPPLFRYIELNKAHIFMTRPSPILRESEAGFRILFECATIGIVVINGDGDIQLTNSFAEDLFGYTAAELAGKPIEVLIPEDLRDKHVPLRDSYFKFPAPHQIDPGQGLCGRRKNGEVFPVEISLGSYEMNDERLAVAFVADITERVKAKKIIAEEDAWFRNIADNYPGMIWVSGGDKSCTYFNRTWLEFTGQTMAHELGNGWAEGVHPEDIERCLSIYHSSFDARQPFKMEYRLRRYDGEFRWVMDVGKPTYSSENVFTGYIGSCSDIQDQRMMKEELELLVKQRTNELSDALYREKEMNKFKSTLVSMASHEFRTPLSIVLSSVSLIEQLEDIGKNERVLKYLVRIKSSVKKLTAVLNDFLSLDKLENGNAEMESQDFDIKNFIQELVEELRVLRKKGQEVYFSHKGLLNVTLDQKKLRYVLVNLISNSMKYSSENSGIYLQSATDDRHVQITVQDHGIGIPEEEQKNMFHRFFRARNTGNVPGTGLGLTIVKRYVELMSGKILFTSKAGEGTTFIIDLPRTCAN